MPSVKPRETVILAVNFDNLVAWYRDVLGFRVTQVFEDDYHYANLETPTGIQIGIADATEMGVSPTDRSQNSVVMQFEVEDVAEFFAHLNAHEGAVTFGPSYEEKGQFWFGGFADVEGNPFWVVDKHCP